MAGQARLPRAVQRADRDGGILAAEVFDDRVNRRVAAAGEHGQEHAGQGEQEAIPSKRMRLDRA
jgi:hypothetical protein